MPKINLGRVRGYDGGFGNVGATYANDGGEPRVSIEATGPDTAKDFTFEFANLVNDPISSNEIDQIVGGQVVESSNTLNATGLSTLWARLVAFFAPKEHTHAIAEVSEDETSLVAKLDAMNKEIKELRDSQSRTKWYDLGNGIKYRRNSDKIELILDYSKAFSAGWNDLGTLPAGFRPNASRYLSTTIGFSPARGYLNSEGLLRVYSTAATKVENIADQWVFPM